MRIDSQVNAKRVEFYGNHVLTPNALSVSKVFMLREIYKYNSVNISLAIC